MSLVEGLTALQNNGGLLAGAGILIFLLSLAFVVVVVAGLWKTFAKAGEPGWAAIVPIYNIWIMIKISGNEWWLLLLLLVPFINFLVGLKVSIDLAKAFGQGIGFGLGLTFLGFIFFPLLGFGDYQYRGPPQNRLGGI